MKNNPDRPDRHQCTVGQRMRQIRCDAFPIDMRSSRRTEVDHLAAGGVVENLGMQFGNIGPGKAQIILGGATNAHRRLVERPGLLPAIVVSDRECAGCQRYLFLWCGEA